MEGNSATSEEFITGTPRNHGANIPKEMLLFKMAIWVEEMAHPSSCPISLESRVLIPRTYIKAEGLPGDGGTHL